MVTVDRVMISFHSWKWPGSNGFARKASKEGKDLEDRSLLDSSMMSES